MRVKNVLELINNDFLSTDDQLYFSGLLEKGELFKNPLSAVPLFNLAEMTLSTTETPDQRQQGLIYLHFAFRMLHHNLLVNRRHGRAAGAPGPAVSPKVRELYSDHEGLYRSLYIRCLTIMSLVDSLEKAS